MRQSAYKKVIDKLLDACEAQRESESAEDGDAPEEVTED